MTERQAKLLAAIIEQYAEIAAPVGSIILAKLFGVSSATIRAEMAVLEERGYIAQPHTSAGRVPTDKGYRFYVNQINDVPSLDDDTPKLLDRSARAIDARVATYSDRTDRAIRSAVDSLVEITHNLGLATIGDQLYMNGMGNLFSQPEFAANPEQVARLIDNLEPWLREAAPNEPLNVFIGAENPIGKSSQASLIISRFRSPYSDNSYIGVLGPTRQDYAKVMRLVRHTGAMLEEVL